jgi:hypothetical protein
MWTPAPQPPVGPEEAGVDRRRLTMPDALSRLDAPPVFITGCARSGTNWALDVFAQHPDVCAIVETWLLTQTHGVVGVFTQREWNSEVSQGAVDRVGMRHAAVQLLPYEQMVSDLGELVGGWLMRSVRDDQRFLVAKEPLDVHATTVLFPEARFVHVIRDGRDVALSMRDASESWDASMGVGLPMSWRAEAWRRQVEVARQHRDVLGDRYLEIRFEDLKRDVGAAARTLFEFAGIPYDDTVLDRVRGRTKLSNYDESVRRSGFRGRGQAGDWRSRMTLREGIGFRRAAGALLLELGYERDSRWLRELLPQPRASRGRSGRDRSGLAHGSAPES